MNYIHSTKFLKVCAEFHDIERIKKELLTLPKEIQITGYIPLHTAWEILGTDRLESMKIFNVSNYDMQDVEFINLKSLLGISYQVGYPVLASQIFNVYSESENLPLINLSRGLFKIAQIFLFHPEHLETKGRIDLTRVTALSNRYSVLHETFVQMTRDMASGKIPMNEFEFSVGCLSEMVLSGDIQSFLEKIQPACPRETWDKLFELTKNLFQEKL